MYMIMIKVYKETTKTSAVSEQLFLKLLLFSGIYI